MLINALRLANDSQRASLMHWIEAENPVPEEKIAAVTALYDEIGVPALAQNLMDEYYQDAMHFLEMVNLTNERKSALCEMAERLMKRKS